MILNSSQTHAVSTMGWVDRDSIWSCHCESGKSRRVRLGPSRFLTLHAGQDDLFALVHHDDNGVAAITAHRIDEPEDTLARVDFHGLKGTFSGDSSAWGRIPRSYLARSTQPDTAVGALVLIDAMTPSAELRRLEWFQDAREESAKGLVGVVEVPGSDFLIISMQRDSEPVLYDPHQRKVLRKLQLADQRGNPLLRFRRRASELWANDYDHLVRVETIDWSVVGAVRLQPATAPNALFIGEFSFNADETLCAVARPFSGDVLGVDTHSFQVTHRAEVGQQPLEVVLLSDGRVLARDWKTGELLSGMLKPL